MLLTDHACGRDPWTWAAISRAGKLASAPPSGQLAAFGAQAALLMANHVPHLLRRLRSRLLLLLRELLRDRCRLLLLCLLRSSRSLSRPEVAAAGRCSRSSPIDELIHNAVSSVWTQVFKTFVLKGVARV